MLLSDKWQTFILSEKLSFWKKKTKVKLQKEISSHCLAKQVEKIACVSLVADMMVGVFKVMYCCFSKVKMQNRLVKWENVVITLRL